MKDIMENKDRMRSCARNILREIGEIKNCDCGETFYQMYRYDEKDIYAIATNKFKEEYGEQSEYKTFHEAIKEILEDAGTGDHCLYCNFKKED